MLCNSNFIVCDVNYSLGQLNYDLNRLSWIYTSMIWYLEKRRRKFKFKMVKQKIFQIIQRNFTILGISSSFSRQNDLLNKSVLKATTFYMLNCILNSMFLICEANNFREFTDSIIATISLFGILLVYVMAVLNMTKLFEFIQNCENAIDERKKISLSLAMEAIEILCHLS